MSEERLYESQQVDPHPRLHDKNPSIVTWRRCHCISRKTSFSVGFMYVVGVHRRRDAAYSIGLLQDIWAQPSYGSPGRRVRSSVCSTKCLVRKGCTMLACFPASSTTARASEPRGERREEALPGCGAFLPPARADGPISHGRNSLESLAPINSVLPTVLQPTTNC